MTAITARPRSQHSLLRFTLRADATICSGLGLFVAMAADPLSRLSGLSATSAWLGGAALVAYGTLLYALAGVSRVRRVGVAVVTANIAFAAGVLVVLRLGALPLTEFGVAMAVALVGVTLALSYLQYLGVRRLA